MPLPDPYDQRVARFYADYEHHLKPLLAQVEAETQRLPSAVLNELRAFIDHISRCYRPNVTKDFIEKNLWKARNHLKRAILDCAKNVILALADRTEDFFHQTRHLYLTEVNKGAFFPELYAYRQKAIEATRDARLHETKATEKESWDKYQKAMNAYSKLDAHIRDNVDSVNWASYCTTPAYPQIEYKQSRIELAQEEPKTNSTQDSSLGREPENGAVDGTTTTK